MNPGQIYITILGAVIAILALATAVAVWRGRRQRTRQKIEHAAAESIRLYGPNLTAALNAQAEHLDTMPGYVRSDWKVWPPCDHEDGWCNGSCAPPRGRHHAPPLEYGPEPIVATVTDLASRRRVQ